MQRYRYKDGEIQILTITTLRLGMSQDVQLYCSTTFRPLLGSHVLHKAQHIPTRTVSMFVE